MFSGVYIYFKKLKKSLKKSLTFSFKSKGRSFLASMHSAIGMWVIPIYLVSSITGLYWSYSWFNQGLYTIAGVEKPVRMKRGMNKNQETASPKEIQNVIDIFDENIKNYNNANLRFTAQKGIYIISYLDDKSIHNRAKNIIKIDKKTNKIVEKSHFSDQPLVEKLLKSNYSLHTGDYFGIIGKIVMFLGSLAMMMFFVTGVMMYLKRKG